MPSVSNIAIGANMAAAAANKARHGMNESIARLSTGIRAMYGGDAAGHSVGSIHSAQSKGYAAAARNVEDGISYLQAGESVLLEVANMGQRLRELGIQADNAELLSTANKQIAAMNAEASILSDSITNILGTTKFNGLEVVDSAGTDAKAAIAYTGDAYDTVYTAGPATSIADTNLSTAAAATGAADTFLASVSTALGQIAADLTALKAFQGAASATSANTAAAAARIMDTDYATETASLTKNSILNQAALAMAAQANNAQSAILSVLQ